MMFSAIAHMDSTGSFEVYVGPDVGHLHKINTTPALAGVRYLPFSFRVPAGATGRSSRQRIT
jgi:hypothetical protein